MEELKDLHIDDAKEDVRLNTMNLLQQKKLCLVLDLDHTLLNTAKVSELQQGEKYLLKDSNSVPNPFVDSLKHISFKNDYWDPKRITKLRPFVHKFLKEASELFEMYIYTKGSRSYAEELVKLLDPEDVYFGSRVITRDDSPFDGYKSLELVPVQENVVVIMDDSKSVWKNHVENLIHMERYNFFASSRKRLGLEPDSESLSQRKVDESEECGALASALVALKRVHRVFFEDNEGGLDLDVRDVLKQVKKEVLRGCKIAFCEVFLSPNSKNRQFWKMAEELGAKCCVKPDKFVTHVVSIDAGTMKSLWAIKKKKILILPQWIERASYLWKKPPEDDFLVSKI